MLLLRVWAILALVVVLPPPVLVWWYRRRVPSRPLPPWLAGWHAGALWGGGIVLGVWVAWHLAVLAGA